MQVEYIKKLVREFMTNKQEPTIKVFKVFSVVLPEMSKKDKVSAFNFSKNVVKEQAEEYLEINEGSLVCFMSDVLEGFREEKFGDVFVQTFFATVITGEYVDYEYMIDDTREKYKKYKKKNVPLTFKKGKELK